MGGPVEVSSISDERGAREFLLAVPSPRTVRAVAQRADELRLLDPQAAVRVAEAALEALARLPRHLRRPRLAALVCWVFGSACRATTRFDEAEVALLHAGELLSPSDRANRLEVLRRLAYLRADQRRNGEASQLMSVVVASSRRQGGVELGRRLTGSSAILVMIGEFSRAAKDAKEALSLLPHNGDRFHAAAHSNLARCRVELSITPEELHEARTLVYEARKFCAPGSFDELRWNWLRGNLLRRFSRFEEGIAVLEKVRSAIDRRADGFERALLLVDLAEAYIEAGDPESARRLALSSFTVLQALRNEPEAYKALALLHQAASDLALDRAAVRSVRAALLGSRR